jgi:branched-chain amino acid transport system permease protein
MQTNLLPAVITGTVILAGTYILIALGFTVAFRATRVLNFAEGQFMLLASYLLYFLLASMHLPLLLSLIGAALLTSACGLVTYRTLLRPLAGQGPLALVLCTLGLSIVLTNVMSIIWGTNDITLHVPVRPQVIHLPANASINTFQLATVTVALVVYVAVLTFLRFSRLGVQMRATAEQPLLASQTGINIYFIMGVSWSIIGFTAALAGMSLALTNVITPTMAQVGLTGLAPAIAGGLDSIGGVLCGAIFIALVQNLAVTYLGGDAGNVAAFLTLLLIMAVRPFGFFGTPAIDRV